MGLGQEYEGPLHIRTEFQDTDLYEPGKKAVGVSASGNLAYGQGGTRPIQVGQCRKIRCHFGSSFDSTRVRPSRFSRPVPPRFGVVASCLRRPPFGSSGLWRGLCAGPGIAVSSDTGGCLPYSGACPLGRWLCVFWGTCSQAATSLVVSAAPRALISTAPVDDDRLPRSLTALENP